MCPVVGPGVGAGVGPLVGAGVEPGVEPGVPDAKMNSAGAIAWSCPPYPGSIT